MLKKTETNTYATASHTLSACNLWTIQFQCSTHSTGERVRAQSWRNSCFFRAGDYRRSCQFRQSHNQEIKHGADAGLSSERRSSFQLANCNLAAAVQ